MVWVMISYLLTTQKVLSLGTLYIMPYNYAIVIFIGADGLVFVLPGQNSCDYTMRLYNSDGTEPQICGNAIRCVAKFLHKINHKGDNVPGVYRIWTNAGVIVPSVLDDGSVEVDMGEPILDSSLIPTTLQPNSSIPSSISKYDTLRGVVVDQEMSLGATQEIALNLDNAVSIRATAVSMGNPHSVSFVDDLDSMNPPFNILGPLVESYTACFPERVNAEFVQVIDRTHVRMKVWERGAGPTLACGTGACAVVVAGVLTGRTERQCRVTLPGGDLFIHWKVSDNKVYMKGPAVMVCSGEIELELFPKNLV